MNKLPQIVIVEDNDLFRTYLLGHLQCTGEFEVLDFASAAECLQALKTAPDAYLLDHQLDTDGVPGETGLELLHDLRERGLDAPAAFLTAHEDVQPAAEILKGGAFDYLRKEKADMKTVVDKVRQMVEWQKVQRMLVGRKKKFRKHLFRTVGLVGLLAAVLVAVALLP